MRLSVESGSSAAGPRQKVFWREEGQVFGLVHWTGAQEGWVPILVSAAEEGQLLHLLVLQFPLCKVGLLALPGPRKGV